MAEPVRAGPGGFEQAGVASGGERVREIAGRDAGQLSQDIPAEMRAQDRCGLNDRTGGLEQCGQPGAGDAPDGVGDQDANLIGTRFLAGELPSQFSGQQGDCPRCVRQ